MAPIGTVRSLINQAGAILASAWRKKLIGSVSTLKSYQAAISNAAAKLEVNRLKQITVKMAQDYLKQRCNENISQKTLDKERVALQFCPNVTEKLIRVLQLKNIVRWHGSRIYTKEQIREIIKHQKQHNALATRIVTEAGLRAHELATLEVIKNRPPSPARAGSWAENRFAGREQWTRYTVQGKGGLIREIRLSPQLAEQLEKTRLKEGRAVNDRGIKYRIRYDIGFGNSWSKSFTDASNLHLGWSRGGHGLRHTYAQERLNELIDKRANINEAKLIVSQELGHFRPSITNTYLR